MPPPRNFKFHDNILSFAEHDIVLCFVSRVDTVDNPNASHLKYKNVLFLIEIF